MLGKRLIKSGAETATGGANTFASENFNTVLYTGNGSSQKIGGYINKGAVFDGSSSYIDLGNNSSNNGSLISVSCWFKTTSTSAAQIWNNGGNDSSSTGLALKTLASGVLYFQANTSGTSVNDTGTTTVNDGNWHHVVVNYDNGDFNVYLDGSSTAELTGTSSAFTTTANQNFIIGRFSRLAVDYFNGVIDQFRIFNRELTTSEVTTLYGETYSSTTKSTTDIFNDNSGVALYQFDGNAFDTGGVSGKYGAAAHFNGSNSFIGIPSSVIDPSNVYSVSMWVNFTNASTYTGFFSNNTSAFRVGEISIMKPNASSLQIFSGGQAGTNLLDAITATPSSSFVSGAWYHIVVISDRSISNQRAKVYVNGSEASYSSYGANQASVSTYTTTRIGNADNQFLNGRIDDVRIYSDELTSTEIGYIYNNTTASIPTDNLLAYYKLNGDARDETIPSYDGAASNVTYAYNASTSNITYQEATKFSPDLVWIKNRTDSSTQNLLTDTVRGIGSQGGANIIYSDSAEVESTNADTTFLSSFDSNGFSIGSSSVYNSSGKNFVAWCFKGGGSVSADNNSDGSETTTVSANQDAGFSIVKLNKTDTNLRTYGHGLSSVVEMIILKRTASSDDWYVYHKNLGNTSRISLNSSAQVVTGTGVWGSTTPTDQVFTLENQLGGDHIAYCFHDVAGYQKIGSYTSAYPNTTHVETGFEPAFVMIKSYNQPRNWCIHDNKRKVTNTDQRQLYANLTNSEADIDNQIEFTSNGFLIRGGSNDLDGGSSYSYIYLAIAADPDTTTPTVDNSFDIVTYSGSSSSQNIDVDFKADLVFTKSRNASYNWGVFDSVRGAGNWLQTNTTDQSFSGSYGVEEFNTNSIKLYGNFTPSNYASTNYVAYLWKAGDHDDNLPQINTNGSVNSTVSVNDAAGFSIVKFTTSGGTGTVGHGLSSAPEVVLMKRTNTTSDWYFFTTAIDGSMDLLKLNTTDSQIADSTQAFTSTTFKDWASSGDWIAYCWYSVTGHSKIGSYTGNGTSQSITTGFAVRFVLIKSATSTQNWMLYDSTRGGNKYLIADIADAEGTSGSNLVTFNSNGFSVANSNSENQSGQTFIYMAFK